MYRTQYAEVGQSDEYDSDGGGGSSSSSDTPLAAGYHARANQRAAGLPYGTSNVETAAEGSTSAVAAPPAMPSAAAKYHPSTYIHRYTSVEDAHADRHGRCNNLPAVDDLAQVKSNERVWIVHIMNAIESTTYAATPAGFDEADWKKYQVSHLKRKDKIIDKNSVIKESERVAWILLGEIYRIQQHGVRSKIKGMEIPTTKMLCSERLAAVIDAVKDHPIIANDVLRGQNLDQIAAAPKEYIKQKTDFKRSNDKRKKRVQESKGLKGVGTGEPAGKKAKTAGVEIKTEDDVVEVSDDNDDNGD